MCHKKKYYVIIYTKTQKKKNKLTWSRAEKWSGINLAMKQNSDFWELGTGKKSTREELKKKSATTSSLSLSLRFKLSFTLSFLFFFFPFPFFIFFLFRVQGSVWFD